MVNLTIKANFPEVQKAIDRMSKEVREKAIPSALRKVAAQAKTAMGREIRKEYALTASEVNQRLRVELPRLKSGSLLLEARLIGSGKSGRGRSINVIRFIEKSISLNQARRRIKAGEGGRQQLRNGGFNSKALQLRVKIKKTGPAKVIEGAFIANKGRTVFIRKDGVPRLPIEAVQTIDVPQMFNAKKSTTAVLALINKQLPVVMGREIAFFTRKFGG